MQIAVRTLLVGLSPKIISQKQKEETLILKSSYLRSVFSTQARAIVQVSRSRVTEKPLSSLLCSASPGLEGVGVFSPIFEDFSVCSITSEDAEIKIRVDVNGAKTQAIFDDVFSKMVAAAQPIPGFRRVKGGKTPEIPRDVLLHILGPSKVYKEVIKRLINSTVAQYVKKEGLEVSKNLRVEQSFEDLESAFEPGKEFCFDAIIQLRDNGAKEC